MLLVPEHFDDFERTSALVYAREFAHSVIRKKEQ